MTLLSGAVAASRCSGPARHVPQVIFVTAFDRYAVSAFEVRSFDYLLKPLGRERFAQALARARERLGDAGAARVARQSEQAAAVARAGPLSADAGGAGERASRVAHSAARPRRDHLLHVDDTLVFARAATGRFLVDRTLPDLERQFERRFFRAYRGCLVNLGRISGIWPLEAGAYAIVRPGTGAVAALRAGKPASPPVARDLSVVDAQSPAVPDRWRPAFDR